MARRTRSACGFRGVFGGAQGWANTAPSGGSEDAIRQVLATQQAAWNRGDIPTFLKGYWSSPELTFSGSNGTVRGYDGVLERYRKSYPDRQSMGELDFSDLEIEC